MKDEMKKNDAMESSELNEEELEQATGGLIVDGKWYAECPFCRKYDAVENTGLTDSFRFFCNRCNMPFNV